MKTRLLSVRSFVLASAVLWGMSLYGQETDISKQVLARNKEESALLEKLKEYMQDRDARAEKIIQELAEYGSTNVVQFFFDNISWRPGEVFALTRARTFDSFFPMLQALLRVENVPLHQCIGALLGSKDETNEAQMIAYVAKRIHGEDFRREFEKLIEISPNPKRWETLKTRLENNIPYWQPLPKTPAIRETEEETVITDKNEIITTNSTNNAKTENFAISANTSDEADQTTIQKKPIAQDKQFPAVAILFCALLVFCVGAIFYFMRRKDTP
jgi:hypothetical protein